jgi:hypothetical protein
LDYYNCFRRQQTDFSSSLYLKSNLVKLVQVWFFIRCCYISSWGHQLSNICSSHKLSYCSSFSAKDRTGEQPKRHYLYAAVFSPIKQRGEKSTIAVTGCTGNGYLKDVNGWLILKSKGKQALAVSPTDSQKQRLPRTI